MGNQEANYLVKRYRWPDVPENYWHFIFSKWKNTYRHYNDFAADIDAEAYYRQYNRYVPGILGRQNTVVRLSVLEEDPDIAFGFSVTEEISVSQKAFNILHYVYVHSDYRMKGIGRKLVPLEIHMFTHLTNKGKRIRKKHAPDAKFNPFY